jgi:hypothetical protein
VEGGVDGVGEFGEGFVLAVFLDVGNRLLRHGDGLGGRGLIRRAGGRQHTQRRAEHGAAEQGFHTLSPLLDSLFLWVLFGIPNPVSDDVVGLSSVAIRSIGATTTQTRPRHL